uniref:Coiled-coil domain containing 90B n=1 Tax=Sinocyclocheilus grahami TaxID=75366 RepID=A0A672LR20_SINGR
IVNEQTWRVFKDSTNRVDPERWNDREREVFFLLGFHKTTAVKTFDVRKVELTPLEQRKLTFDSHALVKELESSGFEKRQAEVIVTALVTLTTANMDIVYRDMVTGAHQHVISIIFSTY